MADQRIVSDADVAGEYEVAIAESEGKALYAWVEIDRFGGHRHYFTVWVKGKGSICRTESLSQAMRRYNEAEVSHG